MNERDLFIAALQKDDAAERSAYLADACAGDTALRQRIENLLDFHAQAGSFLNPPIAEAAAPTTTLAPPGESAGGPPTAGFEMPAEDAGTVVACRYKLLQEIGEGGMGSVWMAEQTQPVKRLVALKLIKPGMDSKAVLARFEAERQALALMDHPNIAKVLDGGTTDAGRPYFVMELVKGIPLTQYCDDRQLTVRQRLDLFVQVCSAVQHAHQKGIIHRDLKPSNVLVTEHDGTPMPKVIDFGLAKALHHQHALTEHTLFTAFGTVVGTPLYMAPEQVALNALDVDTRSDIFSLGVILYELLTGTTPLEKKRFADAAWDEIRRLIREEEPPKPSARLSTSLTLASIASLRQVQPAKLGKLVRGELDWIVMRALEKDRNRRYSTANAFARDVQRYLADEAVEACPPSAGYRVRKFARKHKAGLTAATAFAALLLTGIAVSAWQAVRATRAELVAVAARDAEAAEREEAEGQRAEAVAQRDRAAQAEVDATRERDKVVVEKRRADAEAAVAKAVNDFLQNDLLRQAGSAAQAARQFEPTPDIKVRTLLDRAAAAIGQRFQDQPQVEAAIRKVIGDTYFSLTVYDPAIAHLTRAWDLQIKALGPDHPDTLKTLSKLAVAYNNIGKNVEAIRLHEQERELLTAKFGPDHPNALNAMHSLALNYRVAGRKDDAIQLLKREHVREAASLGPDHAETLKTLYDLAAYYSDAARTAESLALLEQERDRQVALFGPDHPATLKTLAHLARANRSAGRTAEAIRLLEHIRDQRIATLGLDHQDTLTTLSSLASAYGAAGRNAEAVSQYAQVLDRQTTTLGPNHSNTLLTMHYLAQANGRAGRTDEAIRLFEQECDRQTATLGPDHRRTLNTQHDLAIAYSSAGRIDDAIRLNELVFNRRTAMLGPDSPDTLLILNNLAVTYGHAGRTADAIRTWEQFRALRTARYGPNDGRTLNTVQRMADYLVSTKQYERAVSVYRESLDARSRTLPADHPDRANALAELGKALLRVGQCAEAEPVLRECLAIREKKLPDDWLTFNAGSMLGGSLAGQKKYAEAEPLLVQGYEGLKQREAKIPAASTRPLEALERLVRFYETTGQSEDAMRWRKEGDLAVAVYRKSLNTGSLPAAGLDQSTELARIGKLLLEAGLPALAESLLRECLAIREQNLPGDWKTCNARSLLGAALLGQQKYVEAEPLLLQGYAGLKQSEAKLPSGTFVRPADALEWLVQLYEIWGKPDEAAKWRAERSKGPPPIA